MSGIIKLLPDALANQIAAGEVVQRPASVVKELLENSVDAGASQIKLIVKEAGKTLIQVIDNGCGMTESDARMCFERHATSKLKTSEDLFNIQTMGFRGEAMASIAAVAQVELKTKTEEEELGTLIKIEGSDTKVVEQTSCTTGSSIAVKNLFFNVPARRNFLKSNPVELKHILEEFQRVALANPGVSFQCYQNDIEVFNLIQGKLSQRIVAVFGKSYQEQLVHCEEDAGDIHIFGYVGKPEKAKKTRGEQYFFANGRFIKHHYLHHAVVGAFEGLIPADTYPFYCLFIEIDPSRIDINVHPTKTEVKFDDDRTMYGILKAAVKKAVGVSNVAPSIDFGMNVNFDYSEETKQQFQQERYAGFDEKKERSTPQQNNNRNNWEKLYDEADGAGSSWPRITEDIAQPQEITFSSALNTSESIEKENVGEATRPFQIHLKYIVAQVKSGMMLIDQQAAHERVLYERFQKMMASNFGASQQFLFPQQIELSPTDYALVKDMEEEIKALGFVINDFGQNTIILNGIPSDIPTGKETDLFEQLLEQFKRNESELKLDRRENLTRSLARRSAIHGGTRMEVEEMKTLIDQLFACSNPNYGPGGTLTYVILDMDQMATYFLK